MSKRKDIEVKASAAAETSSETPPIASASPEQQILSLPASVKVESPTVEAVAAAPAIEPPKPAETPKAIELPIPVAAALKAVEAMKPAEPAKPIPAPKPIAEAVKAPAAASKEQVVAAAAVETRSSRFALLAASVALAGCVGAMAGGLAFSGIARAPAETPLAAIDLTSVQDSIASLRAELASIKSSVDNSSRNSNAQFARFTERFERIDRAQAAPAAQLKQAMDAIERLEKRAQATTQSAGDITGSLRPQPAAATASAEPPRPAVLDGWVVRHVSRGVAVIQSRIGAIEVEAGDVVPGIGRIEAIRRQDGRWVVLTSKGKINSPMTR